MATRIQLRRDTAAQWTANNPTLSAGELGYETDTKRVKIGNGTDSWSTLSYIQIELGTDTSGNYVATLAGTANQVSVSGSGSESAAVTISLPQDIATTSSPTFAGATLDAIKVGVTGSNEIDTSSGNLTIDSAGGTVTVDDNLVVSGNLTVSGTTTTVNTEEINLADNIIVLNANATGSPTENAGIEVERGDSANVVLRWNESLDTWEATRDGSNYYPLVLAGDDIATSDITNFTEDVQDVVGGMVSSNTESGIAVTYDDENGKLNFDVSDPTLTFTGDATGSGTITNLGNTSIELTVADNSHNHTASNISDFTEATQDVVGGMVDSNTESGISVSYDDETGKLNFNVNDPTITLSGDVTGSATMTDLGNVTITTTVAADSVTLGTDTTGDYVATIAGTTDQISVAGEGTESRAVTLSLPQSIATTSSPTFAGATLDSVRVGVTNVNEIDTSAGNLILDSAGGTVEIDDNLTIAGDLTVNGTTTTINATNISVDDKNIELGSVDTPTDTTANGGGITLKGTTDKTFNWSDTTDSWTSSEHIDLASGKVIKINGTQVLSATEYAGNAATVTNGVVTTGSYSDPTWITSLAWSKISTTPTTLSGYGITDAQALDADLTAIAGLTGTSGFLKKTAENTWSLDTSTYLTGNQTITLSGDVSGSGTTSISVTVADDSHNHIISNVDGLQTALDEKAPLASPTFTGTVTAATLDLTTAATATTATSYWVETGSDGIVRPKTLANVRAEIVTNDAVNSAAATTVGTITSGTWAATDVALAHGGTNASLTAVNGGVVYSTASAMAITSAGTAGQVLTSNGEGAPTWQSAASGGLDPFLLGGM